MGVSLNCIQTLSELEAIPAVHEIVLKDTKAACTKMLDVQEVKFFFESFVAMAVVQLHRQERQNGRDAECTKAVIDDLRLSDSSRRSLRTMPSMYMTSKIS
jgi:hypothetical protein